MFSPELAILVSYEQHQDRLRRIEQLNLIATTQRRDGGEKVTKAIHWLGNQLVSWGTRLQTYHTPLLRHHN